MTSSIIVSAAYQRFYGNGSLSEMKFQMVTSRMYTLTMVCSIMVTWISHLLVLSAESWWRNRFAEILGISVVFFLRLLIYYCVDVLLFYLNLLDPTIYRVFPLSKLLSSSWHTTLNCPLSRLLEAFPVTSSSFLGMNYFKWHLDTLFFIQSVTYQRHIVMGRSYSVLVVNNVFNELIHERARNRDLWSQHVKVFVLQWTDHGWRRWRWMLLVILSFREQILLSLFSFEILKGQSWLYDPSVQVLANINYFLRYSMTIVPVVSLMSHS